MNAPCPEDSNTTKPAICPEPLHAVQDVFPETTLPDEAATAEMGTTETSAPGTPAPEASQSNHNRELGKRGERAAALFLERRGYEILARNWRCPAGEADIIARDEDGTVVFAEVKTRSGLDRGFPSEAVTPDRRRRYERIAGYYLSDHIFEDARVRFDILSILALEPEGRAYLRHHVNAYGSDM